MSCCGAGCGYPVHQLGDGQKDKDTAVPHTLPEIRTEPIASVYDPPQHGKTDGSATERGMSRPTLNVMDASSCQSGCDLVVDALIEVEATHPSI